MSSYLPGFTLFNLKTPSLTVVPPIVALFKNTLAFTTGCPSRSFNTLPEIENWAKTVRGNNKKRMIRVLIINDCLKFKRLHPFNIKDN
jgi:hypothetical protein